MEIEAAAATTARGSLDRLQHFMEQDDDNTDKKQAPPACTTETQTKLGPGMFLPTDRSYEPSRVQELSHLTESDRQALVRQLGYLPGNALEVVARIKDAFSNDHFWSSVSDENVRSQDNVGDGFPNEAMKAMMDEPLVIKLYPLALRDESDGTKSRRRRRRCEGEHTKKERDHDRETAAADPLLEPFPTIFWVTHPLVKALVSKLELDGIGKEYEKRLQQGVNKEGDDRMQTTVNPKKRDTHATPTHVSGLTDTTNSVLASMKKAHWEYSQARQQLILPQDWDYIRQRKWEEAFSCVRGIAGIRNPSGVKCLHAHVAHFWSGCKDNIVGEWVAGRVVQLLESASEQCSKD
jgi:hypothetical protein